MKVDVIKTSFAAGIWGQSLFGRTDITHYENACAEAENMLVRPYGGVISTPGTRKISETKLSAAGTDSSVRLIPFIFNRKDSYVIEMGDKYFRFYTDRGQVLSGSSIYEIAHPYSADELDDIQFTQLNDIIWFAHPDHHPQQLTRYAADSWSMSSFAISTYPETDDGGTAWTGALGYPASVVFHEQRLWWARTDEEPQGIWGSKIGTYDDYGEGTGEDDDGINIKVASNEANELQWLLSGNRSLLAGSYGGVFVLQSGTGETLTPGNINARQEVSYGTMAIQPKRIGAYFYYVQRFAKKLRELFFKWEIDSYEAADKTIYSPEITGTGIKTISYQEVPETILWCLREDGKIATLTREVTHEVQGWSLQSTDGDYESLCVVPSQTYAYDEVWVVVKRTINGETKRYIEVFENIIPPTYQEDCLYLHSALNYNAYEQNTDSTISLSATSGTITITASTTALDGAIEGRRIRAVDSNEQTIGECRIESNSSGTLTCTVVKDFDSTSYEGTEWGLSVESLSGLDHLEGKSVKVLADGGTDLPDKTVSAGSITLEYNYFKVAVGLPYRQKVVTLPFEAGGAKGTAQGKKQRINQIAFKVNNSHKGFLTAGDEDDVEKINWRDPSVDMGTPEQLYTGILPNINFRDDYQYGSQVYIINDDPLPIEILSIMCSLETFEK